MKSVCLLSVCLAFLLFAGDLKADAPDLKKGVKLEGGGSPISLTTPYPTVVDWNNDGNKDLVVGQYTDGNVWLFINKGTDAEPVFNGGSLIESNGTPITTTSG